jgi:hypothetical protein
LQCKEHHHHCHGSGPCLGNHESDFTNFIRGPTRSGSCSCLVTSAVFTCLSPVNLRDLWLAKLLTSKHTVPPEINLFTPIIRSSEGSGLASSSKSCGSCLDTVKLLGEKTLQKAGNCTLFASSVTPPRNSWNFGEMRIFLLTKPITGEPACLPFQLRRLKKKSQLFRMRMIPLLFEDRITRIMQWRQAKQQVTKIANKLSPSSDTSSRPTS